MISNAGTPRLLLLPRATAMRPCQLIFFADIMSFQEGGELCFLHLTGESSIEAKAFSNLLMLLVQNDVNAQ